MNDQNLTSVLKEERVFQPPVHFSDQAEIYSMEQYHALCEEAHQDSEAFWARQALEYLDWITPFEQVLDWQPPFAKWFLGGQLNLSANCLDRHLSTFRRNKAALIWEGEPGDSRTLTYQQLHREVCRFANVLKKLGIHKGDRVALYMPMIPELAIAMLACARIGAVHSIVFGGFSAEALRDRIEDAQAKMVVTADGGWRRGQIVPLKDWVDQALEGVGCVEQVVVVKRTGQQVGFHPGRDHWWDDIMDCVDAHCPAEALDSEHPLFILYTSGTTGKPKGVVHSTAGYLLGAAYSSKLVFDLKEDDTYWCTADIGWITGHSYVVYGMLANGATTVMYEGAPNTPDPDRFWQIIDKYQVSIFYTAPTAIRAFIKWGEKWPLRHDLSSLRLLGTVGEPINPEAWMWYHSVIGKNRCPIVDTWWQTETGAMMIAPLPGATPLKPGTATLPLPGIFPEVVDREGNPVGANQGGYLVITKPWPSMLRTVYGDPDRYVQNYWSRYPGLYFTGDGARQDADGYFWIMGRVDDVLNVSGHRLGTMEVESALVSHEAVAEAAVVGKPDEIRGEAVVAFVTLESSYTASDELKETLRQHVVKEIGAIARPEEIIFTDTLPKTRSGKIMRRLLRDIAAGRAASGDTSTLEDASILDKLRDG
ncbi:acetate--CoA ligase [bacterium (Candidatus Blackallbacteria) CG17_big_fil_post_rev_8_21_14_2_50_48_46]|uniref:Acetyl-coenzyme A synthetase n=1 Tax=bacterium (Candidatus Blackallbacteria) CG17_big_fil_post_rev_8_21_14_2_50_48_46 TaxID=2014261 RepID=A0A2M7G7Y8_9BACT|nr:MAG: acetate--CoA ligase [bacterium (Candidatus Blackallbacteria) CG18_big_fil_WC_8_21_14_2_50_49_26]PIW18206.1 MAG: acetate--CoA ligase [bacterium (Candidatus Blackallbacteria) CG17_big_fil_post_rev_8_21_14_2_50_48_46]PIW50637.1 MAG: acetate--CoA ligase [bacterium (Candidatus Blackallbacteria) CG13_big_fil_rev_8_21_14_2_50_49_14]